METTRQLLRAVKVKHQLVSDGALARLLGLERASISQFMRGKNFLGHDTALRVAELLNLSEDYVIACAEAERAKSERTKAYWRRAAERASSIAAALLVVVFAGSALDLNGAYFMNEINGLNTADFLPLCIMLNAVFVILSITKLQSDRPKSPPRIAIP